MAVQRSVTNVQKTTPRVSQAFVRFSIAQRLEHILLLASFTTLAITGLIQKFAGNPVAEWTIQALGGIENVRTIHHIAAIVFVLEGIYHVVILAHKIFVQRVEMSMLPGLKDVTDGIDVLRHNLGLTKEHPQLPRYNYAEKMEYWAMAWGFVIMAITGFVLWNPIAVSKILPGQFIPAAKAAHGAEAILAVLAILVWHLYNVHIKTFNKSIFTGKMTRHQMEEEHAEELVRLETGQTRPRPKPEAVRQRERIFLPVALVGTVVAILGVYWLATFESTAIATVPPATLGPAFVPLTPTPAPSPTGGGNRAIGAPMPHPVEGQEQCDTCHGPNGVKPMPADHVNRPNESCLVCHQPGPAGTPGVTGGIARSIPHSVEGREQCDLCHSGTGSLIPLPADHAGRGNQTCTICHKPAEAGGTSEAGMPRPIPHSITETIYKDCTACHGPGKLKPVPENHAGFTADSCTKCHPPTAPTATPALQSETPAASGTSEAAARPKPIPHSVTEAAYKDCTVCHGPGKIKPAPENHTSFTVDSCTTCHKPAQAGAAPEAVTTPSAGTTPTPEAGTPTATGPKPIPHSVTEAAYKDCTVCHGPGKMKPAPENHASFTVDSCTTCHKPAQAGATPEAVTTPSAGTTPTLEGGTPTATGPKPIPHDLADATYKDCTICHGPGKIKPAPENHASFTVESCTICHKPAQAAGTPEAGATPGAGTATPATETTPTVQNETPS